jgi:hypothetical protein
MINLAQEKTLYALKTTLQTYLPGVLSQITTEQTEDSVSLPDVADYEIGYKDVLQRDRYPRMAFYPEGPEIEPAGQNAMDYTDTVSCVLAVTDYDPEVLVKRMLRYTEAIRETVQRHQTLGGACSYAFVSNIQHYPGAAGSKLLAVAIVTVEISTEVR